jgi:tetratricopeptide (TPR) repeat protein
MAMVAAVAWALVRRPAIGFLGASFFAVLAASSSVVPVATETMAEHRMYLPLAAVAVLVVLGIHRWLGRGTLPLCLALAAGLSWATWQRNGTYRSSEEIWSDTVAKRPENERAQYNLGCILQAKPGRLGDAVAHYEEALRLKPGYAEAHNNLGNALDSLGRTTEAIAHFEEALRLKPNYVEAHNDLGIALGSVGRTPEAIEQYEEALRLKPDFFQASFNLGNALDSLDRTPEAIEQYEQALRIKPDDATIHFYLAGALLRTPGRIHDAAAHLREVVRLQPDNQQARQILARIDTLRQ